MHNWSGWTLPDLAVSLVPLLCIPAFVLWRASRRSRLLVFRAAAGPLLSIAIGLSALLVMVVAFSGFELDGRSVHAWRELLIWLRDLTEIPSGIWLATYLLLAGAGVAIALWPGVARSGLRSIAGLGETVGRADKVLSVLHTTLMVITLFALATPTIEPAARRQLRWQYRVALQEQVDAEGQFNAAAFLTQQIAHQTRDAQAAFGELIDRASQRASDRERHAAVARLAEEHANVVLGELPLLAVQARDLSQPLPEETEFVAPLRGFADAERRLADVEEEQARAKQDQESLSPAIDRLARASTAAATALFSVHPSDEYVAFGAAVCADYLGQFLEALSKGGFARIARLGHGPSQALVVQQMGRQLFSLEVSIAPTPAELDQELPRLATGPVVPLPDRSFARADGGRIDEIIHERVEAELRDVEEGR